MTAYTVYILIALLVHPTRHADEPAADAWSRYGVIAEAIAAEAKGDEALTRYLLTVAMHESSFSRKAHDGRARGDDGRSWGLYQIMCGRRMNARAPGTDYEAHHIIGVGPKATRRATEAAAIHLRTHIAACKGAPRCVFLRYGGLKRMPAPGKVADRINARLTTYGRLARLRQARP